MAQVATVTIRELRNHGGEVLARVEQGERLIVTKCGRAVAELRPIASPRRSASVLVERWRQLPTIDPDRYRADLERVISAEL